MLISVCSRSIIVCQFPIKLLQPFAEFYMAGEYCVVLVDVGHRGNVINFINGRTRGGLRCNKITVVIMSSVQVRAD